MEILFLILKFLGILLAFLILLVLAVIAVPVRYRISVNLQESMTGIAVFYWFWHLIHLRIQYEKHNTVVKLRIFGFPVRLGKHRKKKTPKKIGQQSATTEQADSPKQTEATSNSGKSEKSDTLSSSRHTRKKSRVRVFWEHTRALLFGVRQKFREIRDRSVTVKEQVGNIKKLISEETNKNAAAHIFQELKFLLRHYSPRKASGELSFGMEDPAQTGQILGVISFFPFWTKYKVQLMPDFQAEEFYVKGSVRMKGHVRFWHFLLSGIRLIKDKNTRALMEIFRT